MKFFLGAICIFFNLTNAWAIACADTVNVNQVLVVYKPLSPKNANAFLVYLLPSAANKTFIVALLAWLRLKNQ